MEAKKINRQKRIKTKPGQWKLYRSIHYYAEQLDRLPDARSVQANRQRSAPLCLIEMVF